MTITFKQDGTASALWGETVNLAALGRMTMRRASNIEWDATTQEWRVLHARTGVVLFAHQSRQRCITWEHANPDQLQ